MITQASASAIAHGDMPFHNPIAPETVDALIELLPLQPGDRVLDVGCGRGELLLRLAEQLGVGGLGVDLAEWQIATAGAEAAKRVPGAAVRFVAGDATALDLADASFALGACVGSTHALGGLDATLARLAALVQPGGLVLVGEGFWAQRPSPEYLEALGGATEDELPRFPQLLAAGAPHGLAPLYAVQASTRDWEHYEWANILRAEDYARRHPDEEGVELLHARVAAARRRRAVAAESGEPLGFALILWRRPG